MKKVNVSFLINKKSIDSNIDIDHNYNDYNIDDNNNHNHMYNFYFLFFKAKINQYIKNLKILYWNLIS